MLDTWTHARELITKSMMHELEHDYRDNGHYVNPLFLMANSGARGGVEQMRQLAGMRGLMAKPSGEIIETPIKANFREGLTVLEYFSSTHGARKGLADTALKTADSGYLTRKLADICQNMVITTYDCGTTKGITRGVVYRGEKVEVSLADAIRGRVSRTNIVNPITDEVIVREDDLVTIDIARKIEDLGLEKIQVRSPMTCEAQLGICRLCYGMDLSSGNLVEEGLAVGIIAAQSIGEPGTQLTMRTFHIGGAASREVEENEIRTRRAGRVRYARIRSVVNQEGKNVVLTRNGEIIILDPKERELEKYTVPNGATLLVAEDEEVEVGRVLCQWDPHSVPILAEVGGKVRFDDCIEGRSIRSEREASGNLRRTVIEHKGDLHPQIILEDSAGKILDFYYLPERATIDVQEGQQITAGSILAKNPREATGTQDIVGGLPRVTELFEARKPKDPAIIAEIDGEVELVAEKKRGKRVIIVRGDDGTEVEHIIPHGKQLLVHANDRVRAGDALVRGPLVPHDILRVSGAEAVQQYLLHEIQNVYRSQRVEIDDKHIEIVVSQMLRKLRVRRRGRLDHAAGGRPRQVRVPQGQRGVDGVREDHRSGEHGIPDRRYRPREHARGSQRPGRGGRPKARQVDPSAGRHRQHSVAWNHQGGRAERKLHLGGQFPGDDQGAHRSGPGRQGRQSRRPEGKRHPGSPDPGWNRVPCPSGSGSPHSARSSAGAARREGTHRVGATGPADRGHAPGAGNPGRGRAAVSLDSRSPFTRGRRGSVCPAFSLQGVCLRRLTTAERQRWRALSMNRCPFCDHKNPPGTIRCAECKAELFASPEDAAESADSEPLSLDGRVIALMREGRKIEAIKLYRDLTGAGLKEAKDAVESLERGGSPSNSLGQSAGDKAGPAAYGTEHPRDQALSRQDRLRPRRSEKRRRGARRQERNSIWRGWLLERSPLHPDDRLSAWLPDRLILGPPPWKDSFESGSSSNTGRRPQLWQGLDCDSGVS